MHFDDHLGEIVQIVQSKLATVICLLFGQNERNVRSTATHRR